VAVLDFALDVVLNGDSYSAARGQQGERQIAVTYVPKIRASAQDSVGDPALDPLDYTTFHRGAGASRSVEVVGMYGYGENVWTVDPGLLMPGPEVSAVDTTGATVSPRPDGTVEADGHLFFAAGRYVFRIPNGSGAPVQDLDLGVGHVGYSLKRFGTSIFLSNDGDLYERPDGGAWTNALTGTNPVAPTGALGTVWWTTGPSGSTVTLERLVAQFGPRGIRYCSADPRNDTSWTPGLTNPAIDVGGTITRFATTTDHLYIATTSGLRDLDVSGMAPNLLPEAEHKVLSTGGLAAMVRGGVGYVSAGYDLYQITLAGTQYAIGSPITPMTLLPNETPVGGYGTAIVPDGEFVIYSQYDPVLDTTWVMWGREPSAGQLTGRFPGDPVKEAGIASIRGAELGPFVWNVAPIVLHGWKVTAMHISGLATDGSRLWMFGRTADGSVSAKWAPIAFTTPYADLKAGRPRRFAQSCFIVLPSEDGGEDAILKDVEEIQQESENLVSGNSIKISAAKEGDSSFTQLASFTTGPRTLASVATAFITQRPTFRIDMVGTPVVPPISRRTTIRWLANPDVREVRRYTFQLGRAERMASGTRTPTGAEEQVAKLVTMAKAGARVSFDDEVRNKLIVRVLKVEGPTEVEAAVDNERVLACAVTISVFGAAPGPPFGWDQGVPYDSGRSWS
jgi:hypothetical protein